MENTFDYDFAVVGAGTGGCTAAYSLARSGASVVLLERKSKNKIGDKVCGDGIGSNLFITLKDIGISLHKDDIIVYKPEEAFIVTPDKKTKLPLYVKDILFMIDRQLLGQTLLLNAINAGSILLEKTRVKCIHQDDLGVNLLLSSQKKSLTIRVRAVIDASGINSAIRKQIFPDYCQIKKEDTYSCYRQILEQDSHHQSSNETIFEFDQKITKGGYIWHFNKGDLARNIGLGIPGHRIIDNITPQSVFSEFVSPRYANSHVKDSRGGFVPTRRPLPSLVSGHVLLVGDAGAVVNPMHGGGIGSSIISGNMASIALLEALDDDDFSSEALWKYNILILERYNKRYALLDIFRLIMHNITNSELNSSLADEIFPMRQLFFLRKYHHLKEMIKEMSYSEWANHPSPLFYNIPRIAKKVISLLKNYPKTPMNMQNWAIEYERAISPFKIRNRAT